MFKVNVCVSVCLNITMGQFVHLSRCITEKEVIILGIVWPSNLSAVISSYINHKTAQNRQFKIQTVLSLSF